MTAEAGSHDVVIAASTAFTRELVGLRREFRNLLPPESIVPLSLPRGSAAGSNRPWLRDSATRWHRRQLLELAPDAIHVASVFSGWNDDVVVPWPEAGDDTLWAATLYDLIPWVRPDEFLGNKNFRSWYEGRLANLRRADLLLAISEASRTDAIQHLGLPPDSVQMVGAAIESDFSSHEKPAEEATRILRNLGIHGAFIFYLGGYSPHKNFGGLLKAYALLPASLREQFKLVLAGEITESTLKLVRQRQHASGLRSEDVILLEKLSDAELCVLYAQCHAFVFPSHYEGFGLPILEAMSCGAPVICSNTSSMLEVVGDEAATFDPADPQSISNKLQEVLEDGDFRRRLVERGRQHAETFRWQTVARKTWAALEEGREKKKRTSLFSKSRSATKIAIVASGPAVTGLALSLVSRMFPESDGTTEIEWIFPEVVVPDEGGELKARPPKWLADHAADLDHILYWIDHEADERWIRSLLENFPGVVVILKFFAGDYLASAIASAPEVEEAAWQSHGYEAHFGHPNGSALEPTASYPCNLWLFENAVAVVSPYPWLEDEAKRWYGDRLPPFEVFQAIAPLPDAGRRFSRRGKWNAQSEEVVFLVWQAYPESASHGRTFIKEAWRLASLRENVRLEFFDVSASLSDGDGWIEGCDVLVALGSSRRGGEPRVVIQALEAGKRVISNTDALPPGERQGYELLIRTGPAPSLQEMAEAFSQALMHLGVKADVLDSAFSRDLARERTQAAKFALTIGREATSQPRVDEVEAMAKAVACQLPRRGPRQFLIDVSELAATEGKSGIQRVVRCTLDRFLNSPPAGFRVEPVRCSDQLRWVYARNFSRKFLGIEGEPTEEPVVEAGEGDIFLALDLNFRLDHVSVREQLELWRTRGVFMAGVVYDLLPILNPQWFGAGMMEAYGRWLGHVLEMHAVIAISETVSGEIRDWMEITGTAVSSHPLGPLLGHFHLGADVGEASRVETVSEEVSLPASSLLAPNFLMVGTVEPRKGHEQVLGAFETLWEGGSQARLVIVGKRGWQVESLTTRIKKHRELGKRLIWFDEVDDEERLKIYARCQVVLAASFGEGFGFPLLEGARRGLPIIARDIPVFREVAGTHAFYFSANRPEALALELTRWLELFKSGTAPRSEGMKWLTWEQSAANLWAEIVRCRDLTTRRLP